MHSNFKITHYHLSTAISAWNESCTQKNTMQIVTGQRSKSFLSEQHKKTSPSNFATSLLRIVIDSCIHWIDHPHAFSKQQTAVAAEVAVVSWCSTLLHFTEKSDRLSCQWLTNNITNHVLSVKWNRTSWLPKYNNYFLLQNQKKFTQNNTLFFQSAVSHNDKQHRTNSTSFGTHLCIPKSKAVERDPCVPDWWCKIQ